VGLVTAGLAFARSEPFQLRGTSRPDLRAGDLAASDGLVLGPSSAPTKLVVFGDYECPPCRLEWPKVRALYKARGGTLSVYFRSFPLAQIHPRAVKAALVAEHSKRFNRFPQVHEELYSKGLDPAIRSGERWGAADAMDRRRLERDLNLGYASGVQGTPALFYVDSKGRVFSVSDVDDVP
jgi:protein-disulfide isomerase